MGVSLKLPEWCLGKLSNCHSFNGQIWVLKWCWGVLASSQIVSPRLTAVTQVGTSTIVLFLVQPALVLQCTCNLCLTDCIVVNLDQSHSLYQVIVYLASDNFPISGIWQFQSFSRNKADFLPELNCYLSGRSCVHEWREQIELAAKAFWRCGFSDYFDVAPRRQRWFESTWHQTHNLLCHTTCFGFDIFQEGGRGSN